MTTTYKAEAADIRVFIVMIGSYRGMESTVGAAYWTEHEARKEVKRLKAASQYARAYYVCRSLSEKAAPAGWGHG
jgi:hypothetical protein